VGVMKEFDGFVVVLWVDFSVVMFEIVCIVGFSGCGKSILLNIMVGFDSVIEGDVCVVGNIVIYFGFDCVVVF